jgi:RNA polymerase sigma-70 factor (ECF subfamily)
VYRGVSVHGLTAMPFETAYARAYEAHWNDVFRFALAWTNDWAAAEDVAQETFVRLWRHGGTFDWDRDVLPWLLVTARRLVADRFRMLRRRLLRHPAPATLDETTADRWLDVQQAMTFLSPLERVSLVLTALEGRDSQEVARLLGTSAGAVRAAASRAREKLEVVE